MSILQECFRKIQPYKTLSTISAELIYPKLVIFEEKCIVRIYDMTKSEEENIKNIHSFDKEISHYILDGPYLWVLLTSGELFVIHLMKSSILEVKCNSYTNYKIRRFMIHDSKLIFISESGEKLSVSLTNDMLEEDFNRSADDVVISFEKSPVIVNKSINITNNDSETAMYVDAGKLMIKCNVTGLVDTLFVNTDLHCVSKWNDLNVLCDNINMWALNRNFDLIHTFKNTEGYFYPLTAYNDTFYYLSWNDKEVRLF